MADVSVSRSRRASGWIVAVLSVLLFLVGPVRSNAQDGVLTGTVVTEEGVSLIGAHVVLRESGQRTVVAETNTSTGGTFQFAGLHPGRYVVEVTFLGFREQNIPLVLERGESRDLNVEMEQNPASLETTVVSPSRRRESLLNAPASVSVLEPERIRREAATSSVEALRSIPGADFAQTGIDRRKIALRGFNSAASGSPHVLVDHRETGLPGFDLNLFSLMPNTALDLERIEAVRGPVSALYGSGADGGMLHFFTKDPFQKPGTSIALSGGSRSYMNVQFREAGVLGQNVGYKFTGQWGRADEWPLDPQNPDDAEERARYRVYDDPNTEALGGRAFVVRDVDADGDPDAKLVREDRYRRYNANGLLKYRFDDETSLSVRGGFATLTSPLQSMIGTIQASNIAYTYGQARLASDGLSAQVSLNRLLPESDVYRYDTGESVVEEGTQFDGRAQYGFSLDAAKTEVQVGGEVDVVDFQVKSGVGGPTGEAYNTLGAFLQTKTPLASALDLSLAGRADYLGFSEEVEFSPRAALVYTPTSNQALRLSYNRTTWEAAPSPLHPEARNFPGSGETRAFTFLPETTTETVEVGYKAQIEDRFVLDVAGYYENRDNVAVPAETGGYVNAGEIDYWGLDVGAEGDVAKNLTLFGNTSVVSDDTFRGSSFDPDFGGQVALNAPALKLRGGIDTTLPGRITLGATVQYVDGFPVRYGPYDGTVGAYTLVDVRLHSTIPAIPGLSVNLTAKNLLDNDHREFIGAPQLGRTLIARLTYRLP